MIVRRKPHIIKGEEFHIIKALFKKEEGFGNYISEWESSFASYLGVRYAAAVSSGRRGMELILNALNFKAGDEIIIPSYTLKDLIGVIRSLGLKAVLADINPYTFNIDYESVVKKRTARTKAILATHLFGTPCQIDKIADIAKSGDIFIIEDCAHSLGAEFNGRKTGTFGDAAFFSFETAKPINTYGGGMVVTNDSRLASKIRQMVNCGNGRKKIPIKKIAAVFLERYFFPTSFSFPFLALLASGRGNKAMTVFYRLLQNVPPRDNLFTNFQAFLGLKKLETLDERIKIRSKRAELLKSLSGKNVTFQQVEENMLPNYYFLTGLLPVSSLKIRKLLLRRGIDSGCGAEIADDCASFMGERDCFNAKEVFRRAIQLPLYEDLSEKHIRRIADVLNLILKGNS